MFHTFNTTRLEIILEIIQKTLICCGCARTIPIGIKKTDYPANVMLVAFLRSGNHDNIVTHWMHFRDHNRETSRLYSFTQLLVAF